MKSFSKLVGLFILSSWTWTRNLYAVGYVYGVGGSRSPALAKLIMSLGLRGAGRFHLIMWETDFYQS